MTGSHTIVILFTTQCQLYIWGQSHPFSSIVAFVYKLLHSLCIFTSSMYSNVTTSTRINSSSVHTYICVCFIRNHYNTSNSTQGLLTLSNIQQGIHKWNTFLSMHLGCAVCQLACTALPRGHIRMGQVFTFAHAGWWTVVQVRMLHWFKSPCRCTYGIHQSHFHGNHTQADEELILCLKNIIAIIFSTFNNLTW